MAGTLSVRDPTEWKGVNFEFFFATSLLRLRSLHYGYWDVPPTTPINLAALRLAQDRFTEKLLSYVPDGTSTVLDVGAGLGDISRALAARGLRVTALSPDRNHARFFRPLQERGVEFHTIRFEDFNSPNRFDTVLISEALNYFEREIGLSQCRRLVRPEGHLLVAAMFRYRDHRPFPDPFHPEKLGYVTTAARYGFTLVDQLDITTGVAPTMQLARRAVERYLHPMLRAGEAATRWLALARASHRLREVREYYSIRTDPAYFLRSMRYLILLLRRDAAP